MSNKIWGVSESAITWLDTGGSAVLTLTSLGAGAGRQGAHYDFNLGTAKAIVGKWRFYCQFDTNPVVGEAVRIYWKTGDGTRYDNDDGVGDIAVSAEDKLKNLHQIGTLVVDQALLDVTMSVGGILIIDEEIGAPVIWNATADNLRDVAASHGFTWTPITREIQ